MSLLRVGTAEFWSIYGYLGIKSSGQRAQKGSRAPMGEIPKPRSVGIPTEYRYVGRNSYRPVHVPAAEVHSCRRVLSCFVVEQRGVAKTV